MTLLSARLVRALARSSLGVNWAWARSGTGERASRLAGAGSEFTQHREYLAGDDLRHVDPNVFARLGEHAIKQFTSQERTDVAILLDASRSMAFGRPMSKLWRAAQAAGVLGMAGLAGGDRVTLGVLHGSGISWHPRLERVQHASSLLSWLEHVRPKGDGRPSSVAVRSAGMMPRGGVLIVVSDWLDAGASEALQAWSRAAQEVRAVHVLTPEERDPRMLGDGLVRVTDAETGAQADVTLDASTVARYQQALADWTDHVRDAVRNHGGRYMRLDTDDDFEQAVLTTWRSDGWIS